MEVEEASADEVMVVESASAEDEEEEVSLEAAAARTTAETEATSLESFESSILTSAQNCYRVARVRTSSKLQDRPQRLTLATSNVVVPLASLPTTQA